MTDIIEVEPTAAAPVPSLRQEHAVAPDTSPRSLLRFAMQQGASLEQLERFMALVERDEAATARRNGLAAMTAFKAEPMEIFKRKAVGYTTKEGEFVGYKHAELSDVTAAVVPAMAKHGLSHRWNVVQDAGKIAVTCTVTHASGHSESVTMEAPPDTSGKKNTIQAIASAVSYLQRYTLLAVTGMATTGMDDDGTGASTGTDDAKRKRGEELEAMAADMIALFQEGREVEVLSIWHNDSNFAQDIQEANDEREYAWKQMTVPKLHAFLKANGRKNPTK